MSARPLTEARFQVAEFKRSIWHVTVEETTTLQDALESEFWVNVIRRIRPQDIIEIHNEGVKWFARLYVVAVVGKAIRFHVLESVEFVDQEIDVPDAFEVKWRGPNARYAIVRKKDGQVMRANFQTSSDAAAAAVEFARQAA